MTIPLFHVDAFTDRPFAGNPAAVCLLPSWKEDRWLQAVAREMNLSETAFLVTHPDFYPRFGFSAKLAEPLSSPFGGREAWMALELVPGALAGVAGWVRYPP